MSGRVVTTRTADALSLRATKHTAIQVRCTTDEKHKWQAFASEKGLPLSVYVRALLNALVERAGDAA